MAHSTGSISFSFGARLAAVMTGLLLITLITILYLNQQAQRQVLCALQQQKKNVDNTIDQQFADVVAATNLAMHSLSDVDYLSDMIKDKYRGAINEDRIRYILIAKEDGLITDSTKPELRDRYMTLPALVDPTNIGGIAEKGNPVSALTGDTKAYDTYWFRAKTVSQEEGERYSWIAIVVSTEQVSNAILQSQQELAGIVEATAGMRWKTTLGIFVLAGVLTIWLVRRFARPVQQLSEAAARIASGDLSFTVEIRRNDEMGQLARTFNGMIEGLKAKSELEEQLNNAERAAVIGRLTSAIAHEIRNPLNFINLSIDHVRSKYSPEEPRDRERFDRLLGTIKDEVARLNRLVTDVLNFGRPARLNVRQVDLREVIDQVLGLVRTQADQQGVEIEMRMPDEPAEVDADAEKLKSCFSNIVINAIQAMPAGGRLMISLDRKGDDYNARFTDTGSGIPEEAIERVFEPYYSTKDTGTGLGLAVTKKIIDEHRGRVVVKSEVGQGTTFEVDIPRTRPRAA